MEKLSPEQQERLQEYLETRKISKYPDRTRSEPLRLDYIQLSDRQDETRWNQVGIIS